MSIINSPCPHIHRECFQASGLYVPFLKKYKPQMTLREIQFTVTITLIVLYVKYSYFSLTLVMQEIQSTGNLLHNHTGFLLAEVASLVNVSQDGS